MPTTTIKKVCRRCGENKPETDYYYRSNGRRRSMCKPCYGEYNAEQYEKHKPARQAYEAARGSGWSRHPEGRERYALADERRLELYLQRVYGLAIEDYYAMLEGQGYVCAICGNEDENVPRLSVDHDHDTGKVRGLLCMPCNLGIGKLNDSFERVQAAADYLKAHADAR